MGLTEQMLLTLYVSNVTPTTALERRPIGPSCPRGAKMTIGQAKIAVMGQLTNLSADRDQHVALASGAPSAVVGIPSDNEISRLDPLWVGMFGMIHQQLTAVGVPVLEKPKIEVDLDFSESQHRGITIRSTGEGDNIGFNFYQWVDDDSAFDTIDIFISAQIEMEYIETSRSQEANWDMDNITAEETQ